LKLRLLIKKKKYLKTENTLFSGIACLSVEMGNMKALFVPLMMNISKDKMLMHNALKIHELPKILSLILSL